jgi:hypothetical protein
MAFSALAGSCDRAVAAVLTASDINGTADSVGGAVLENPGFPVGVISGKRVGCNTKAAISGGGGGNDRNDRASMASVSWSTSVA